MVIVILAAGRVVRMRSSRAKVLYPLAGLPLIGHVLATARALRPDRLLTVVGHQGEQVEEFLRGQEGPPVEAVLQDAPLGTAHALLQTEAPLRGERGDLLVLSGDVPLLRLKTVASLLTTHRRTQAAITLLTLEAEHPEGYGRVVRGEDGQVVRIVEEADLTPGDRAIRELNAGAYCLALPWVFEALSTIQPRKGRGEFLLTDIVEVAVWGGCQVSVHRAPSEEALGINNRQDLGRADEILRKRTTEAARERGGIFLDPARVYLDVTAQMEPGARVFPDVHVLGQSHLGSGCTVGANTVIIDARVGEGAILGSGCVIQGVTIPPGAKVPPRTRLRGPGRSDG